MWFSWCQCITSCTVQLTSLNYKCWKGEYLTLHAFTSTQTQSAAPQQPTWHWWCPKMCPSTQATTNASQMATLMCGGSSTMGGCWCCCLSCSNSIKWDVTEFTVYEFYSSKQIEDAMCWMFQCWSKPKKQQHKKQTKFINACYVMMMWITSFSFDSNSIKTKEMYAM